MFIYSVVNTHFSTRISLVRVGFLLHMHKFRALARVILSCVSLPFPISLSPFVIKIVIELFNACDAHRYCRILFLRKNHNHRPCRWFAQAPLGPITSRTYRFIESSFYCMMRPTAIEIAAWRILLFVSPWLSVFLNHTLSPAFQTCSSLRSDIFSGHS